MTVRVDKKWFVEQYEAKGLSLRSMAHQVGMDPAALSRTLNGKRKMTVVEVAKIATVLAMPKTEVLARIDTEGRDVEKQKENASPARVSKHPGFGFMKGLIKIEDGFDIAGPFSDEPWDEGYLGDGRKK